MSNIDEKLENEKFGAFDNTNIEIMTVDGTFLRMILSFLDVKNHE